MPKIESGSADQPYANVQDILTDISSFFFRELATGSAATIWKYSATDYDDLIGQLERINKNVKFVLSANDITGPLDSNTVPDNATTRQLIPDMVGLTMRNYTIEKLKGNIL